MKKDNAGKYEVSAGEVITIKVTPIGVAALVAASRDGATMSPEPGTADTNPTYVFTADDSSVVKLEFSFPGAPATAKYDTAITGSGGGDTGGVCLSQPHSPKKPTSRCVVSYEN